MPRGGRHATFCLSSVHKRFAPVVAKFAADKLDKWVCVYGHGIDARLNTG